MLPGGSWDLKTNKLRLNPDKMGSPGLETHDASTRLLSCSEYNQTASESAGTQPGVCVLLDSQLLLDAQVSVVARGPLVGTTSCGSIWLRSSGI